MDSNDPPIFIIRQKKGRSALPFYFPFGSGADLGALSLTPALAKRPGEFARIAQVFWGPQRGLRSDVRSRNLLCGRPPFASALNLFSGITNELRSYVRPLQGGAYDRGHDEVRRLGPNRLSALMRRSLLGLAQSAAQPLCHQDLLTLANSWFSPTGYAAAAIGG